VYQRLAIVSGHSRHSAGDRNKVELQITKTII
jgi:hypothetical protein